MTYEEFLQAKVAIEAPRGEKIEAGDVNPILLPHQAAIVQWMVEGERRACFAAFGLGKTVIQIEAVRLSLLKNGGGRGLIIAPLGVRQEFKRDAKMLGVDLRFIRSDAEVDEPGIYLTNYESVREGKLNAGRFEAVSLDEASVLRGFGGTKTFREFMRLFEFNSHNKFRYVATATPSPNEYLELLAYSGFLEVMTIADGKTRFFQRDSTKADNLTLYPHKQEEFWLWVASWAIYISKPSDLGFDDTGYDLPPLEVRWHRLPVSHEGAGQERDGQLRLIRDAALGLSEAATEKRRSMPARMAKMTEIVNESPDDHFLLWHDLEDERRAIAKALPDVSEVYGSLDLEEREKRIIDFSEGRTKYLATKPRISGSGCNFQRHCHRAIFTGIGFKFNDFIQSIYRIQRFQQEHPVRIDLLYSASEDNVRKTLERKWRQHEELTKNMQEIVQKYGLNHAAMMKQLAKSFGVKRIEVTGKNYKIINNDCVLETRAMPENSVDLIHTSIPFSMQYEYTPSYNDFGNTESNEHFWQQMDYLTPALLRVIKPGRIAAIHVKDRITPGGINGLGYQTVTPFSDECVAHFRKHGWGFLARITVVTDVVRENNQTYRLGWSEQCKDGTKMGNGLPEYVLLFRKTPTDTTNSYADQPVTKSKPNVSGPNGEALPFDRNGTMVVGTGYSRTRWQIDAHGFWRNGGDRPLMPEDLQGIPHEQIFKLFRKYSESSVYDFEHHVKLGEDLEMRGMLPVTFMLLQPTSWHPEVWTDIARMRTLNMVQVQKGKESHLCPLQEGIVNRIVERFSMKGELVFDPFGGIMSVPYYALKKGRRAIACELNPGYFMDGAWHCEAAERNLATPTLFDLVKATEEPVFECESA